MFCYTKEVKGSLRFNYMVPVPDECIEKLVIKDVEDEKYRLLLNKEYQFCIAHMLIDSFAVLMLVQSNLIPITILVSIEIIFSLFMDKKLVVE